MPAKTQTVPRGQLGEVRRQLVLGERGLETELTPEADAGGNVAEQLVDRGDSDRPQHLLPVVLGEGEIRMRHCSARTCLYDSASSSESISDRSVSRTRISHPLP